MGGKTTEKLVKFEILKQLRSNYSLIPIVFAGAFGMGLCVWQICRTLARSPDVHINRPGNPTPYNNYLTKDGKSIRYKYFSYMDYNKLEVDPDKPTLEWIKQIN